MNRHRMMGLCLLAAGLSAAHEAKAQRTYEEMELLTVNEQVTTVITASEPVRLVDISTDKVAGDQPLDNIIRLKPKEAGHEDGEVLAIVTIVTERYRTQYALLYTTRMKEAVTDKEILPAEREAYNNPAVTMSTAEMTGLATGQTHLELSGEDTERGEQGAPHDHAAEQHLRCGRLFLHRFLDRKQDTYPFRHRRDTGEARRQESLESDQLAGHRTATGIGAGTRQVGR